MGFFMTATSEIKEKTELIVERNSPAVALAEAHAEAWSNHDWNRARAMLADDVHVVATSTQPVMKGTDLTGVDAYMKGLIEFAGAVEPGSARVISSIGDEQTSLILLTVRASFGPGGPVVTLPAARLGAWEGQKLKSERVVFFTLQD
jgi:SnoaL-like domain